MHENVTAPAVLQCRPNVPLSLCRIFEMVQYPDIMTSGNLCNKLLHNCLLGPSLGKGPHILQIPRENPFISGNAVFRSAARRSIIFASQLSRSWRAKISRPICQ